MGGGMVCASKLKTQTQKLSDSFAFSPENWKMVSHGSSWGYTWRSGMLFCLKSFGSIWAVSLLLSNRPGKKIRPIFQFRCKPATLLCLYSQKISESQGLRASDLISSFCRGRNWGSERGYGCPSSWSHGMSCQQVLNFLPVKQHYKAPGIFLSSLHSIKFNPHTGPITLRFVATIVISQMRKPRHREGK